MNNARFRRVTTRAPRWVLATMVLALLMLGSQLVPAAARLVATHDFFAPLLSIGESHAQPAAYLPPAAAGAFDAQAADAAEPAAPVSGSESGSGSASGSASGSDTEPGSALPALVPPPDDGEAADAIPVNAPHPVVVDIFGVRSWAPPPPAFTAPLAVIGPQAPPLPFRYIGRIVVDGGEAFVLAEGARVLVVSVGERIDKRYRLEKRYKDELLFRYRPLNISQSLAIGDQS
jgi:hypothetical protein